MTATDVLALAGGDPPGAAAAKIDGLRKFVLLYGAARSWLWLILGPPHVDPSTLGILATILSACAAAAWHPRWASVGAPVAFACVLAEYVAIFPFADNHLSLELVVLALLALAGRESDGREAVLQGILWVTAVVFFHTGLQKVLYGLYFRGEFLAFMVGRGDRFGDVFAWLLPAGEVARLASYDPLRSGQGPYRVDSTPFVAVSNVVYLAELVLAPLLVWRRSRTVAAVLSLALVLTIQLGAREVGFALLFSSLLLSFLPGDLVRRLVPVAGVLFVWALLAALGVLPGGAWVNWNSL